MKLLALSLAILLAGCATLGIGQTDTADRILADLGCLTALAAAGIQVAGDPVVGGMSTASDVLNAVLHVATGSLPSALMSACAQTLSYASQDAQGALAYLKGTTDQPAPVKAALKAKAGRLAPKMAPPVPVVVHLPLK